MNPSRLLAGSAVPLIFVIGASVASATNLYGIGHEFDANFGMQATRVETAVTCVGTGSGFVFDDMWQGIQDDTGWIEVGTSFCDSGANAAKWVWARDTTADGYYESVIQYNVSVGNTNTFKIWNYTTSYWQVYINGSVKASGNYGAGSTSNSADVGLEVTPSRIGSTQNSTSENGLLAWKVQGSSQAWSGADSCSDTSSHIYPEWISYTWWRHGLNAVYPVSAC